MNDGRRQYGIGLNVDYEYEEEYVQPMFYCDKNQIPYHLDDGIHLAVISCPLPIENRSHRKETCYVTNNFFIEKTIPLKDWEMWNDEEFCSEAVKKNIEALEYVKNPTFEMIEEVLNDEVLDDLDDEFLFNLVEKNPKILSLINEERQTPMLCFIALHVDPESISLIKKPIDEKLFEDISNCSNDLNRNFGYDDINNVLKIIETFSEKEEVKQEETTSE